MIFVTVGTHEQQFNRLVKYMDEWVEKHDEDVIIQTGFSTYEPKNAIWQKLFAYDRMGEIIEKARIVITHGGPSSFIAPLQLGKIPIVVPRQNKYDEHVNNHQLTFCREVEERYKSIIVVEDINELGDIIDNYDSIVANMTSGIVSNNERFCRNFSIIVEKIMKTKTIK